MQKDREYLNSNIRKFTHGISSGDPDWDIKIINRIRADVFLILPTYIDTVHKLLLYLDSEGGMCRYPQCNNYKKLKNGRRWILNYYCSKKCSALDFSIKQSGINNTSHRMTQESKDSMCFKLSQTVTDKIKNGTFTPNITNSWAHSKTNIVINGKSINVRSSWEAYFYILNPHLCYENIRIQYFDTKKSKYRNYMVDFCDLDNRILYEIKPSNKIEKNAEKEKAAIEWCITNGYEYKYVTDEWIYDNYDPTKLTNQPEADRISKLIEKSIKYRKNEN